jgi:hypothetical protein
MPERDRNGVVRFLAGQPRRENSKLKNEFGRLENRKRVRKTAGELSESADQKGVWRALKGGSEALQKEALKTPRGQERNVTLGRLHQSKRQELDQALALDRGRLAPK